MTAVYGTFVRISQWMNWTVTWKYLYFPIRQMCCYVNICVCVCSVRFHSYFMYDLWYCWIIEWVRFSSIQVVSNILFNSKIVFQTEVNYRIRPITRNSVVYFTRSSLRARNKYGYFRIKSSFHLYFLSCSLEH